MKSRQAHPLAISTLLVSMALVAVITFVLCFDNAVGEDRATWLVETGLSQREMKQFVETLDKSCDVDIEPQGVSNYIVAYRCAE